MSAFNIENERKRNIIRGVLVVIYTEQFDGDIHFREMCMSVYDGFLLEIEPGRNQEGYLHYTHKPTLSLLSPSCRWYSLSGVRYRPRLNRVWVWPYAWRVLWFNQACDWYNVQYKGVNVTWTRPWYFVVPDWRRYDNILREYIYMNPCISIYRVYGIRKYIHISWLVGMR